MALKPMRRFGEDRLDELLDDVKDNLEPSVVLSLQRRQLDGELFDESSGAFEVERRLA